MGNNVKRKSEILDENTTLREALEDAEIDYTTGIMNLDGSTLSPGDLDKTFADFGITEKCYLLNVVKKSVFKEGNKNAIHTARKRRTTAEFRAFLLHRTTFKKVVDNPEIIWYNYMIRKIHSKQGA